MEVVNLRLRLVAAASIFLGIPYGCFCAEIQGIDQKIAGPPETASLEMALTIRSPIYACGIWPRPGKLKDAIKADRLPEEYKKRLVHSLGSAIRKELLAGDVDPNQFFGVKDLYLGGANWILGQIHDQNHTVDIRFMADGICMGLTFLSERILPKGVDDLGKQEIIALVTSYINYPPERLGKIVFINRAIEYLGEGRAKVQVCHGCFRDEDFDPNIGVGHWWGMLSFGPQREGYLLDSGWLNSNDHQPLWRHGYSSCSASECRDLHRTCRSHSMRLVKGWPREKYGTPASRFRGL